MSQGGAQVSSAIYFILFYFLFLLIKSILGIDVIHFQKSEKGRVGVDDTSLNSSQFLFFFI